MLTHRLKGGDPLLAPDNQVTAELLRVRHCWCRDLFRVDLSTNKGFRVGTYPVRKFLFLLSFLLSFRSKQQVPYLIPIVENESESLRGSTSSRPSYYSGWHGFGYLPFLLEWRSPLIWLSEYLRFYSSYDISYSFNMKSSFKCVQRLVVVYQEYDYSCTGSPHYIVLGKSRICKRRGTHFLKVLIGCKMFADKQWCFIYFHIQTTHFYLLLIGWHYQCVWFGLTKQDS